MQIRPDQIEGIQPEKTQRKTSTTTGQAFDDLLSQEVAKETTATSAAAVPPPMIVNPMLATGALEATQGVDETGTAVSGQVESILDQWDSYAAALGDPESGLKEAYGALEQLSSDVSSLRGDVPDLAETHPELSSIVDELDAMAATERFKFNRGDYL
jgi:hypothetical protein